MVTPKQLSFLAAAGIAAGLFLAEPARALTAVAQTYVDTIDQGHIDGAQPIGRAVASAAPALQGPSTSRALASTGDEGKVFQRANAIAPLSGSLTVNPAVISMSPRMQA